MEFYCPKIGVCIISVKTELFGPKDFNGNCPAPSYKYAKSCCCQNGCCWDKCRVTSKPPKDCIKEVPNSQWIYEEELGFYRAFITNRNK